MGGRGGRDIVNSLRPARKGGGVAIYEQEEGRDRMVEGGGRREESRREQGVKRSGKDEGSNRREKG